jgi:hypothetical protein
MANIYQKLEQVSAKINSMTDADSIKEYLDKLESMIIELPYGDILYEHAYEIAQVRIRSL